MQLLLVTPSLWYNCFFLQSLGVLFFLANQGGIFSTQFVSYETDNIAVSIPFPDIYKCPYDKNPHRCIKIESYLVENDNKYHCDEKTIKISYKVSLESFACPKTPKTSTLTSKASTLASRSNPPESPVPEDLSEADLYQSNQTYVGYLNSNGFVVNEQEVDNRTCLLFSM